MNRHDTVLLNEAIELLNVKADGIYVDCTFGRGGHSKKILDKLSAKGHLYAFDQDQEAVDYAASYFSAFPTFTLIKQNFRHLKRELNERGVQTVDGILFDLGVSSPQFDEGERGFSYQHDARLDMRMDQSAPLTAFEIVNHWKYEQLVSIFFRYGEETHSKQIARKIEAYRKRKPIETTGELADIIKESIPAPARRKGGHPAKRTFQAIRIAVNDELQALEDGLKSAVDVAAPGARIVVITFHSLEDRICKTVFKQESKGPELPPGLPVIPDDVKPRLTIVTKKPILPSEEEIKRNPRARSAKLRVAEKM